MQCIFSFFSINVNFAVCHHLVPRNNVFYGIRAASTETYILHFSLPPPLAGNHHRSAFDLACCCCLWCLWVPVLNNVFKYICDALGRVGGGGGGGGGGVAGGGQGDIVEGYFTASHMLVTQVTFNIDHTIQH